MPKKFSPVILTLLWALTSGHTVAQVVKTDNPWFQRDKLVHFSYAAGFAPALIQVLEVKGVKRPEIIGTLLLFGAGVAKEFLLDNNPSYEDIAINLAGCVAGIYLNRLLVGAYRKNHDKKQNRQLLLPISP